MAKVLKLNNGLEMPVIGLGTYQASKETIQAVKDAIDVGYRHFDCAWFYGNEADVGLAIQEKIKEGVIKREDVFITTKLWCNYMAKNKVVPMCKKSVKAFQLDYVDLFLIHWPFSFKEEVGPWPVGVPDAFSDVDFIETWEGMEECVKLGLTKSIGISNFNSQQIDKLLKSAKIKPVCNQIECNPNINQKKLIKFCADRDIVVVGYCPLGRVEVAGIPGYPQPTVLDKKVIEIGKKYNKTPAQVILNYLVSLGIAVIPKSVTKSRIIENFNIFDFELSKEDVAYLDSLNKNERICHFPQFQDHKNFPFNIEF